MALGYGCESRSGCCMCAYKLRIESVPVFTACVSAAEVASILDAPPYPVYLPLPFPLPLLLLLLVLLAYRARSDRGEMIVTAGGSYYSQYIKHFLALRGRGE